MEKQRSVDECRKDHFGSLRNASYKPVQVGPESELRPTVCVMASICIKIGCNTSYQPLRRADSLNSNSMKGHAAQRLSDSLFVTSREMTLVPP